jgi:cytochrome P450
MVFLTSLEDVKAMFKAPADVLHPGEGVQTVRPIVGPSSFMLQDEDAHMQGRKAILPPYRQHIVDRHAQMIDELVRHEIATWPVNQPVALYPHIRSLALRVALRTVFSPSSPSAERHLEMLHERLLAALSVSSRAVLSEPLLRYGPAFRIWRRFLRELGEADELIFALIDERLAAAAGGGGEHSVLDALIAARNADGSPLSQKRVRDDAMSVITAGHETTASELAWAFQLLAHHPEALGRLVEELDEGHSEEYLTATIQEVLRHRAVFLFAIPRAVKRPIEIGDWTYHPPAHLLACIYLIHHDPELYEHPNSFRPERFLEGPARNYTWMPWGGGRKRCPGLHMATLEMRAVLRNVLAEMTVHPASQHMEGPRWRNVIVTPRAGARVVLRRRGRS